MKEKLSVFILVLFSLIIMSSCTMERKLALEFVEQESKMTPIMVVPPPLLNMYNNKPIQTGGMHGHYDYDSLSFHQSKFLQYISDSAFLENYLNTFISSLQNYKLNVYLPDQLESFIQEPSLAYIFRFAQMELIEEMTSWEIEEQINFKKKTKIIPLNNISLNTWFEVSQKDSSAYFTYFDEQSVSDDYYGDFTQNVWNLDIVYDYTLIPMEQNDIYEFASYVGKLHASYFYDLILNTYIWSRLPEDRKDNYIFLHYDHDYHMVEAAETTFTRIMDK